MGKRDHPPRRRAPCARLRIPPSSFFRKAFGTTITTFITQHRISDAQQLPITTGDSILNVALVTVQFLDRSSRTVRRELLEVAGSEHQAN